MKIKYLGIFICILLGTVYAKAKAGNDGMLKVLQLNVWQDATQVPGAFEAIVSEISFHQPDIVTLSEVRNYKGIMFTERLCRQLKEKGQTYYTFDCLDGGILSRYPIEESCLLENTTINRAIIRFHSQKIAVYAAHLDYTHYACYLPRGYDGISWEECERPKSVKEILTQNDASQRINQMKTLIRQAEKDEESGCYIIIGGDFNEPSWLDWQADTKDLYDHHGFVVPWSTTLLLNQYGFKDAYRIKYPSAVTHPGFTWVADNPDKKVEELSWAPKSDERDRIDFIFYKGKNMIVRNASVIGPKGSIVRGKRVLETSLDSFVEPLGIWPSDHKGVMVTLSL